jgi:hypothetical protein
VVALVIPCAMKCSTRRCQQEVATPRSAFCSQCFRARCARAGGSSSGNTTAGLKKRRAGALGGKQSSGNGTTGLKKRKAGKQSSGNGTTGLKKRKAGKQSSGNGITGLPKQRAGQQSSGNKTAGKQKRKAGIRSGKRRSATIALVVKPEWLEKIFAKEKDWEIRGSRTQRRGWIHLAQSRAGGKLVGRARLVGCRQLPRESFMSHAARHCVRKLADVPYKNIYAWMLEAAEKYTRPFSYKHAAGAVIWARL